MSEQLWTYPRILVDDDLEDGNTIPLSKSHAHYFKTVLRKQASDKIRLFNTRHGEWLGEFTNLSKKSGEVTLLQQTRTQDESSEKTSLFFAPIKKSRLNILIEKAVELGVTDLHPVLTARTQHAKLKTERIESQIREAAEQCERLSIPKLHAMVNINHLPTDITIHTCIERNDEKSAPFVSDVKSESMAFLVGPEGGFTDTEIQKLQDQQNIIPISLGERIYRAETASIICLTHATLSKQK
jgi:16S rRNA (uracil1498-N3)-methyltransferase